MRRFKNDNVHDPELILLGAVVEQLMRFLPSSRVTASKAVALMSFGQSHDSDWTDRNRTIQFKFLESLPNNLGLGAIDGRSYPQAMKRVKLGFPNMSMITVTIVY